MKTDRQVSWLRFMVTLGLPGIFPVAAILMKLPYTVAGPLKLFTSFPILPEGHLLPVIGIYKIQNTIILL
jgi:hypothetical protein